MELFDKSNDTDPMGRFLGEGPGEQPAVFIRDDTGEVSLFKGCTCPVPQDFTSE
jgi:hypothetical protein